MAAAVMSGRLDLGGGRTASRARFRWRVIVQQKFAGVLCGASDGSGSLGRESYLKFHNFWIDKCLALWPVTLLPSSRMAPRQSSYGAVAHRFIQMFIACAANAAAVCGGPLLLVRASLGLHRCVCLPRTDFASGGSAGDPLPSFDHYLHGIFIGNTTTDEVIGTASESRTSYTLASGSTGCPHQLLSGILRSSPPLSLALGN